MLKITLEKYKTLKTWKREGTPRRKNYDEDVRNEIPEFTQKEVQAAIDSFIKCTASDNNGIRAEDTKTCDETTEEMTKQLFNEVLKEEEHQYHDEEHVKKWFQCGRSW